MPTVIMSTELPFEFEPISGDRIDLDKRAIARSLSLAQAIPDSQARWQSYLSLLAFEGFIAWLENRAAPIVIDRQHTTLIQPRSPDAPAAVTQLVINQFRVCIVCVDRDVVEIPASVIDRQPSQFYVAIAVHEEQQQISLRYFIRYDQLRQYQQRHSLIVVDDQTYQLSVSNLETEFERLLLYLTCLEPSAIQLDVVSERLNIKAWLVQPVIDAAEWFQNQVSQLSLFTPLLLASELRSSEFRAPNHLSSVLTEIERAGMHIPETAQAMYQTVLIADQTFRIYVLIWLIPEQSEWSFLAILEAIEPSLLPDRTQLIISEGDTLIVEETAKPGFAYAIAQCFGDIDEQFILSIELANGDRLSLPPFMFHPR